jgi:small-conductance mechanosensitive channel
MTGGGAALALLLAVLATSVAPADEGAPVPASPPITAESIVDDLNAALHWLGEVRVTLRAARAATGVQLAGGEEQLARQALERAFIAARAKAALVRESATARTPASREQQAVDERRALERAIAQEEAAVTRLRARVRSVPRAQRAALERELAGAENRLALQRARLAFLAQLHAFDAAHPGAQLDLGQQIDTLQASVPELRPDAAGREPVAPEATTSSGGTWMLLHRLIGLQQARMGVQDLDAATVARRRAVSAEARAIGAAMDALTGRLRELADTRDAPADMRAEQAEFQAALAQARALAAVAAPLQQQAALLQRFSEDMQGWQRTMASATRQVLRGVGVNLLRLMIAIGVVLLGAALWRMATLRYVTEPSRRRLLLTVRRIVVLTAVVLVVVVHFASELTTLVTALGFAAAGVAFALQTVILAVAGYVSMMAPNGIRVGDHVSLQGPFGYVHGEVIDIGFVRIRLRELAGDPLRPTGRTVVFPNSVVFTGSFFKHPPGAAPEPPELHRAA